MATGGGEQFFFGTFVIFVAAAPRSALLRLRCTAARGHRIGYALSRIVVARTDDGKDATNWAGMLGPLLAESLANSYLPVKEQNRRADVSALRNTDRTEYRQQTRCGNTGRPFFSEFTNYKDRAGIEIGSCGYHAGSAAPVPVMNAEETGKRE